MAAKKRSRKTTKRAAGVSRRPRASSSRTVTVESLTNALYWNIEIARSVRAVLLTLDPDSQISITAEVASMGGFNIPRVQYCPPA